ncbi:MAG: MMPL family transporter [Candidatus Omnitrophica bacterium]|nr:MMPL family transporter [Candidatus Omnitrophota bacterium]MDD5552954.1 MMPL family transporter [Candidatus Omnitrophota bacterium]
MRIFRESAFLNNIKIAVYLLLTACSVFVLIRFVDLVPKVDENFFFSTSDPQFQEERRISEHFTRKDTQVIINAQGKINSPAYARRVLSLGQKLRPIPGVITILSITEGPKNIKEALESPFWKRVLVSENRRSSNIIVVIDETRSEEAIPRIEERVKEFDAPSFHLRISGSPYIAELIQRNLGRDFKTFSLLAFILFGIIILVIFRSISILTGALISCLNAAVWTLMATNLLRINIGILTANLVTVIFVLTLEHVIFITFNFLRLPPGKICGETVREAVKYTFSPSFWSMATTVFGFLCLLIVPAKPLRELGASGAVGTAMSMLAAYLIFPAFLKKSSKCRERPLPLRENGNFIYRKLRGREKYVLMLILTLIILSCFGLSSVKLDPSLLSYFKPSSEISKGLTYIDHNGGSSPLIVVVRLKTGERLDTTKAYKKLWELQCSLENHEATGTVLSLPVLMSHARRNPIAFFLTWDWLLQILENPKYHEIAKSFVSDDRQYGLFLLRMKEYNRQSTRLEIIDRLKEIVRENGFEPETVGGIYALQGHMSKLVASSLIYGLASLLFVFFVINCLLSRSLRVGTAMTISILAIPFTVLGITGWAKIPLDIIAAPAINVAIGIGIDSMIHMVKYWRLVRQGQDRPKDAWETVRNRLSGPILNAMLIFSLGFGIFLFSQFPPSQRFGGVIVLGVFLAAAISLFLMPSLAGRPVEKSQK